MLMKLIINDIQIKSLGSVTINVVKWTTQLYNGDTEVIRSDLAISQQVGHRLSSQAFHFRARPPIPTLQRLYGGIKVMQNQG